jgi:hypothetical protein
VAELREPPRPLSSYTAEERLQLLLGEPQSLSWDAKVLANAQDIRAVLGELQRLRAEAGAGAGA